MKLLDKFAFFIGIFFAPVGFRGAKLRSRLASSVKGGYLFVEAQVAPAPGKVYQISLVRPGKVSYNYNFKR